MRSLVLLFSFIFLSFAAQAIDDKSISDQAQKFIQSLNNEQTQLALHGFDDPKRTTWDRIPETRYGLCIEQLSTYQKGLLHELLKSCLSYQGYLLATSVMFNEDIQKQFEPNLGKNAYWVEFFGQVSREDYWTWQLEGHHLSLNFTFKGDEMISNTPFLMGSNPQVVNADKERNGYNFIHLEESSIGALIESCNAEQKSIAYAENDFPENMFGEMNKEGLVAPESGLSIVKLNEQQLQLLQTAIKNYNANFLKIFHDIDWQNLNDIKLYFVGETKFNGKHYYRIKNNQFMIECENYGNHTHHLYRTVNDFGILECQCLKYVDH